MRILVTAGNTQIPIDEVRCLTNIFSGRTGAAIALAACDRGHQVTLLTSHPETLNPTSSLAWRERGGILTPYRTFDDLQSMMASLIPAGRFDVIIHAAAVSDYLAAGAFSLKPGTRFDGVAWHGSQGAPELVDRRAGKIKSDEPELWLRLLRAPKLVDRIRGDWGFGGKLVKFKLEVGVSDEQLLDVAEKSRRQSRADWMVANTLAGAADWAFLGPFADGYHKISRAELPAKLLEVLEQEPSCPTSSSA
jgi:phosphopantothenoylcysteine synthetase/decarboxylase